MNNTTKEILRNSIKRWNKERDSYLEDLKDLEFRKEDIKSEIEVLEMLIEFGNNQIVGDVA